MKLQELAGLLQLSRLIGNGDSEINGIQTDSRKVQPGDLFLCIPGFVQDGHDFAAAAAERGAAALVAERELPVALPTLLVKDSRHAMAVLAAHFYGYPSETMKLIGVTGTNGKTTTCFILEQALADLGWRTGLMGTIAMKVGSEWTEAVRTTQEAHDLQRNLRRMADAGTDACLMEVSSHALVLGRVKGCTFRTAIFTNLTQDHLDFHGTMVNYAAAKGLFFSRLSNSYQADPAKRQYAVLNGDDPVSVQYRAASAVEVITYGLSEGCDVRATNIRFSSQGTEFRVASYAGEIDLKMKLIGKFNVYNALAAISSLLIEGVSLEAIQGSMGRVRVVPGRLELVDGAVGYSVVLDYAHTPDGLENALSTIAELAEKRIITVFGCGGDRDRGKRPQMGHIAARYSTYVIATSDNPRSEPPEAILQEIEPGLLGGGLDRSRYVLEPDRRKAIQKAIEMASPGDVVLIAGKGHETTQTIGSQTIHFDDRIEAQEAIRGTIK
ncbi:UDP-N-acetylmuramoyl-L-alanyl-D-glutamate--2,6-diaminopimelate ligase [Paenibacillus koleovorans]|uniref:UDP-N-acetylmuramoyl-L-alanyl-D-glutamate--2, 6-diaminopimelate ligase n=1 Tax=Paenibacillus koleovorans TaxID=121608 RepID=UPI000FD8E48D|nr:UDP-N-acetylmuramoyl-L-alanyl-D-glutamate--2,6-diaminopimelate ligase [Paenibacillus koleovorans]